MNTMDQQNLLFLGCLTVAVAASAFILWGPSPRPKKKKAHIAGLVNLGSTCFLNTLLQALASCAIFIQWLMMQNHEENSLTTSLSKVLWVLNGEGKSDAHTPVEVLSALKRRGWMVPSGEQDAHELFHVIVSTLQDENKKVFKVGSLSDALPDPEPSDESADAIDSSLNTQSIKIVKDDNCHPEGSSIPSQPCSDVEQKVKFAQGDSGSPRLVGPFCGDSLQVFNDLDEMKKEEISKQSDTGKLNPSDVKTDETVKNYCGDIEESTDVQFQCLETKVSVPEEDNGLKANVNKFKSSQESLNEKSPYFRGLYDRATGNSLSLPQTEAPPFQGLLTSTLQCSDCGYYSSLHYDTFDSLSLPLGDNFHFQVLKLQDLLRKFVKTEIIPEVECEKCCKKTTALKTMNIGKLPPCLCLHIARTTWQNYSHTPTKRDDFVDFPEYLPMDEYIVSARLKKRGSVSSLHSVSSENSSCEKNTYKHMYRLKSVVVHLGDVSSGHFLTYRRGALSSLKRHRIGKLAGACKDSRRWYLTSDDCVKKSTLREATESLAYMLFYEKCASNFSPVDD